MEFKLTDEQKNVIKTFMKFLFDPKEKFMIIQGAAGTGKTTMIKAMIESINKQYKLLKTLLCENPEKQDFNILLSATTNKAVAVLRELADDPYVRTIHSTLGLALKKNFRTGDEILTTTSRWHEIRDTILIIDEASMLDKVTFDYINATLIGKSKTILIGDIFQLAPVKQKMSAMQSMLEKVPTATMSTVLRHSGPILEAATAFRNVVQTGVFQDVLLSDKVLYVDGLTFKDKVESAFLSSSYTPRTAKILAWSNDRVQEYNTHLRNAKGLGTQFQLGELVITNNPIISQGHTIPVDSEVEITYLGKPREMEGVPGRRIIIDGKISAFLPDNYKDAKSLMKKIVKKAKDIKTEPKEKKQLWQQYFEIKETWLDLRSQYASTVHKSQGSSYDEVFIDLWDIGRCNIPSDTARMLYVAISRARKRVILSGELPAKYRSPVVT